MRFQNNFDLLRFGLAAAVLLYHLQVLSGQPALTPLLHFTNATYAVLGFFAISGYVVSLSWRRSAGWRDYVTRRARRLAPAYLTVVTLCWLLAMFVSNLPPAAYWSHPETWRYLAANLGMIHFAAPNLPGVFTTNPFSAVNGSLWSIRSEIFCYFLLPAVAIGWRPAAGILSLAALTAADHCLYPSSRLHEQLRLAIGYPVQCFLWGTAAALIPQKHLRPVLLSGGAAGVILLAAAHTGSEFYGGVLWTGPLFPAAISLAVLCLGLATPHLGDRSTLGNLSYGLYLWHFPVIQFAVHRGWFLAAPWQAAAAAACLTLLFAAFSNRLEKALR